MTHVLQLAVMDVAKSVAGVSVAKAVNLPEMLDFGDSFVMKNASNGATYFVVSDAINAVFGQGSKLLSYDVYGSLDDIGFFTATSMVADKTGTDADLYNLIRDKFNLSQNNAELVAESAIVSGTRFLADYIDSQPDLPSVLHVVRHPVSYIMNMTKAQQ